MTIGIGAPPSPATGTANTAVSGVTVRRLQGLFWLALVAPSPVLAPGVFALLSPVALISIGLVSIRISNRTRSQIGARMQTRLAPVVLAGIGLSAASFYDGSAADVQRMAGRAIAIFAVYAVAMMYAKHPELGPNIARALVYGAVTAGSIAIVSGLFGLRPLGAELLPNRDFILPFGISKSVGIPRSFGEAGLIYAAGLVFLPAIPSRLLRRVFGATLIAAVFVGQSRNMLLVLALVLVMKVLTRYLNLPGGFTIVVGATALLSPTAVSLFLASSDLASDLVGSGIYADNVASRLSLLRQVEEFGQIDGYSLLGTNHRRWGQIMGATPHNHFVSLVVMDGILGVFFLGVVYIRGILVAPLIGSLSRPEIQWLFAVIVGLSFYEGVYSAAATLSLGLFFGALGQKSGSVSG